MDIDLPPSSSFRPDPSVARSRSLRDPLTLTLQLQPVNADSDPVPMSGEVIAGAADSSPERRTSRSGIGRSIESALTLTF
jgi:hypothetical protein